MASKAIRDKKENGEKRVTKGSQLKAKYIEFRKNHKKLVSCGLAGLLLTGGIGIGFVGNNLYYNYQYYKSQNQVGIDGDGYFLDPILNYAIQFPNDWGYSTEDKSVIEKAVEDSKTNGEAFRLSQHKLPYEVTPIVFAKDEGVLGYRSFMSVSFRGFYGKALGDAKELLKKELTEILEENGHTGIEYKINELEQKGDIDRLIYDIQAMSKDDKTGEDVITYYHQESILIGKNLCTVILGTTDKKLNRGATVSDLMFKIIETDPDYLYIKDEEESDTSQGGYTYPWRKPDNSKDENIVADKVEVTPNTAGTGSTENTNNKQSIPVEGGTIEIITGTDIDIDALKEMEGLNVSDVDVSDKGTDSTESKAKE